MTAEIAVMNKLGVALAADSAATIDIKQGKERIKKIYPSVDKLFKLSEHAPVAIMIYDGAEFLDIPWETIITAYRKKLGANTFPKLADYANDFLEFIQSNRDIPKYASKDKSSTMETGVVFAGFGEKEYMPVLLECAVCGIKDGKLVINKKKKEEISPDNPAFIKPFAQQKMVRAFLQGIHPDHEIFIQETTRELLTRVLNATLDMQKLSVQQIKSYLSEAHKMLEPLFAEWAQEQKNHWMPIIDMVEYLPKDELAATAEMLVNLTKFHRRINPASETVGGPIDVALITKGDGFKWVKRKILYPSDIN